MKFKVRVTVTKELEIDTNHYKCEGEDVSPSMQEVVDELNNDVDSFYSIAECFFEDKFTQKVEILGESK